MSRPPDHPHGGPQYARPFPDYRSAESCKHDGATFRLANGQEACAMCCTVPDGKKTELCPPDPSQTPKEA